MRNFFVSNILLLSIELYGQAPGSIPSAYSSSVSINYIRTWDAVKPETNSGNISIIRDEDEKQVSNSHRGFVHQELFVD